MDLASRVSYCDSRAIKLRECESRERLVIGVFLDVILLFKGGKSAFFADREISLTANILIDGHGLKRDNRSIA